MTIKHSYTATGTNDGSKQVSVTRWNEDHAITEYLELPERTDVPATPSSGIRIYVHNMAGRRFVDAVGPSGIDQSLQPALFNSTVVMLLSTSSTTLPLAFGSTFTSRNVGTSAAQASATRSTTNALTSMTRINYGTGTTATGASGVQTTDPVAWRGNSAGLGGFFFSARFGIETSQPAMRVFVGLSANNAVMSADASSWNNTVGLCKDSGDTNWFILTRDGTTATKTPTGISVTAGIVLDFLAFCPPNSSDITFRIYNPATGALLLDNTVVTANLPVSNTFLYMQAHLQSTTGTTAKVLSIGRLYLESDL
jgi:hypothetical protein